MKICRHFGECGGCSFQDVAYEQQLADKESRLRELCKINQLNAELLPICSFEQYFYRNKMEFTFSHDRQGDLICGMHKKEVKREVFDLKECIIFSPHAGPLTEKIVSFFQGRFPAYDVFTHKGFLRHLIVRETKITGEMMVGLVTSSQAQLDIPAFVGALQDLPFASAIKSVYWIINDSFGDAVTFENKRLLRGNEFITEHIGHLRFRIFIDSFFQTNVQGVKALYSAIRDQAGLQGKEKVLDLFCGVGSIGFFLAPRAKFVWGVEVKPEIVDNARVNAELNGITNISFICSDTRKFLASRDVSDMDVVVINPPRSGLAKKVKQRLLKAAPPLMFYSSCNPQTLCADLNDLSEKYAIESIRPYDFFPHTGHMECLCRLRRKAVSP